MPNELFDRIAREILNDGDVNIFFVDDYSDMLHKPKMIERHRAAAVAAIVAILEKHYPPVPDEARELMAIIGCGLGRREIDNGDAYYEWIINSAARIHQYAEQYAAKKEAAK